MKNYVGIEGEKVRRSQCMLCDDECESVAHVLWDCPAYRKSFMEELSHLLGSKFSQFLSLDSVEKTSFIMGSELWEENFSALLSLVKRFIVDVWEARKIKLYGNDSCPSKLSSQHSAENLAGTQGKLQGKSLLYGNVNKANVNINKGKELLGVGDNNNCVRVDGCSAHCCGCVVYGGIAMAAC